MNLLQNFVMNQVNYILLISINDKSCYMLILNMNLQLLIFFMDFFFEFKINLPII